jgi:hypothetical protein
MKAKDTGNLTVLIQGVGEGANVSDREVIESYQSVSSTAGMTLSKWLSSAFSFVIPPAPPKDKNKES